MFCGIVDTTTGQLDYCQAGYPSPYYVDQTGTTKPVGDGGFPVGMISTATYENNTQHLEVGGALIICSDAACEAENSSHEPFGNDRVRMVAATTPSAGVQDIPTNMVDALNVWRDGKPLEDDLTVVAIERKISHDTHHHA